MCIIAIDEQLFYIFNWRMVMLLFSIFFIIYLLYIYFLII